VCAAVPGLIIAAASLVSMAGPAWWIAPFGIAALIGLFGFLIWLALVAVTLLIRGVRFPRSSPDLLRWSS
jgi:hypothetical protein